MSEIGDLTIIESSSEISHPQERLIDTPEALMGFGEKVRQHVYSAAGAVRQDTLAMMNSVTDTSSLPSSTITALRKKLGTDSKIEDSFKRMDELVTTSAAQIDSCVV